MQFYGCTDNSLSDHLKCIIKQGDVAIIGKLPEGFSESLQHNWTNPFAEDSVGSVFQKAGEIIQMFSNKTMLGFINSYLTWSGSEPMVLNLPLFFEAENNPENEVRLPALYLKMFSSPTFSDDMKAIVSNPSLKSIQAAAENKLKKGNIANQIPQSVSIKIGRNLILKNCVIEAVESEDPMRYSSDGLPLAKTVTLNIKTRSTLDTSDHLQTIR